VEVFEPASTQENLIISLYNFLNDILEENYSKPSLLRVNFWGEAIGINKAKDKIKKTNFHNIDSADEGEKLSL
jgi:hypothetical protein